MIFFTLQNCIDSGELAPIRLLTVKQALANIINFVGCESFSYRLLTVKQALANIINFVGCESFSYVENYR